MTYNLIFPENEKRGKKKSASKKTHETVKQFAKATSIHGCSYIFHKRNSGVERIVWIIIVALALIFTTYQVVTLYQEWQDEPVITTLETVAEPIENIKFPAVTICPQGSRQEIIDAVLFRQLKSYIKQKKGDAETLTIDKMMEHVDEFLTDVYPGANGKPTQLVKLLSSENPKLSIQNDAILGLNDACDPSINIDAFENLNKELSNDTCPEGFRMLSSLYCIHSGKERMTYNEAEEYCDHKGGANLLHFDSNHDIATLYANNQIGNFRIQITRKVLSFDDSDINNNTNVLSISSSTLDILTSTYVTSTSTSIMATTSATTLQTATVKGIGVG